MADLQAEEYKSFESIKRTRENGTDFWLARALLPVLEYAKWEKFSSDCPKRRPAQGSQRQSVQKISQTEEKIKRDMTATAPEANNTHYEVAEKIRNAIIEMGATLPEDLPRPDKSLQTVEREEPGKLRKSGKPLMLDE